MITATPIDTECWQFAMTRDEAKDSGREKFVYNWQIYITATGQREWQAKQKPNN